MGIRRDGPKSSGRPSRKSHPRTRRTSFEHLESRLALHAGHDHEPATPDPGEGGGEVHHDHSESAIEHFLADSAALEATAGNPAEPEIVPAAVVGPASQIGQWGPLQNWQIEMINAVMLPTGKVFGYDRTLNLRLWNPVTGDFTSPASPGYDIFCTGTSLLADGTVLLTGGHVVDNVGLPFAAIYDPFIDAWTQLSNMNAGRWYPSSTTLANGDVLVLSGDVNGGGTPDLLPQIYEAATGTWRDLTTAELALPLYPRTFSAPNGAAFVAGPDPLSQYLDVTGTGQWFPVAYRVEPDRDSGSAVMYAPGKVLYVGGGDPATRSAEVIDLNQANPTWRAVSSMEFARRNVNATLLPNGEVLVVGGNTISTYDGDAILAAEIWNPVTETFRTVGDMADFRWYHSTSLLLPDATVLSTSGDLHLTGQIYSPSYLFNGARPTISAAPETVRYGDNFFVGTPDAAAITKVRWVRLGSSTHAQDWDQYIQEATFTQTSGGIRVNAPPVPNTAPPGYYMLFILKGDVPSVAKMVKVGTTLPELSIAGSSVAEGPSPSTRAMVFTVSLSLASDAPVTVQFATADDTATSGLDYVAQTGTLTFAPRQKTQLITINVLGDNVIEANESFKVNLSAPVGAIVSAGTGAGVIRDVTALPELTILGTTLTEGNSATTNATFVVSLSQASAVPVTVAYATLDGTAKAQQSYLARNGILTFAPGVTQQSILVPVVGDTLDEINNSFLVRLSAPSGATLAAEQALALIYNNDAPVVANLGAGATVAEPTTPTGDVTLTATLSAPSGKPVVVRWTTQQDDSAVAGTNFVDQVGAITFQPGTTSQTFTVKLLNDGIKTSSRIFSLVMQAELENANYGQRYQEITITNTDTLPGISLSKPTVTESNSGTRALVFTASLSASMTQNVTVAFASSAGTATAPSDYTEVGGTITFTPGATTRTITVLAKGDTVVESNETLNLTLSNPVNAKLVAGKSVGTIVNNDGASAPAAPGNLTAIAGFASATLNWQPVSGAASYRVYRGTSPNGEGTTPVASGILGTTFDDRGLTNGTKYYYWVTAVKTVGALAQEGSASAEIAVIPTPLDFSAGFFNTDSILSRNGLNIHNVRLFGSTMQLTDGGTNQRNSVFTRSRVEIGQFNTQFTFQLTSSVNRADTLAEGITFAIQSTAPTALGTSGGGLGFAGIAKSVAVKFDLFDSQGEGVNSTGLYLNGAVPGAANSIDLTGSGIDLRSGHPFRVNMTYDGNTLTVAITDTVTNATATQNYTVSIPAIVGANTAYVGFTGSTGGLTAVQQLQSWVFTPAVSLAAPTNLQVSSVSATQVVLGWTNVDANSTSVLIERKTGVGGTYAQIGATSTAAANTFTDTTVTTGVTYYYRVRASNGIPNSAYSGEVNATPAAAPLAAPTGLQVTGITPTQVALGWTNVDANSTSVSIERKTGAGGTYAQIGATSTAAANTFTDTTVTTGVTYYYRVRATNGVTNSAYSNEVNATPTSGTTPIINFPSGFAGASSQFRFNGPSAALVGTGLRLTSTPVNQAGSVYYANPVTITTFSTEFSFTQLPASPDSADGMTFTIQGVGPTALGASGGNLGYTGIAKSMAIKFDVYNNNGEGASSTGMYTNGVEPNAVNSVGLAGTGIDLHSGHAFRVNMTYNGTTLAVTITDTVTLAAFARNYTVNIASLVGANTAYVGFTGSTGGLTATQSVLSWTLSSGAAPLAQTAVASFLSAPVTQPASSSTIATASPAPSAGAQKSTISMPEKKEASLAEQMEAPATNRHYRNTATPRNSGAESERPFRFDFPFR